MSDVQFVREYRDELKGTPYPFSQTQPLKTTTGYELSNGVIVDASIYYEGTTLPTFTRIQKSGNRIYFTVGEFTAETTFSETSDILEFINNAGLPGGIFVIDRDQFGQLRGWLDGEHTLTTPASFCPRCLEYIPQMGLQRLRSDSDELFSGQVVLLFDRGSVGTTALADAGFPYTTVSFVGDPTYLARHSDELLQVPIRSILCVPEDALDVADPPSFIRMFPDETRAVSFIACNVHQSNINDDPLRIYSRGSSVHFSLTGL